MQEGFSVNNKFSKVEDTVTFNNKTREELQSELDDVSRILKSKTNTDKADDQCYYEFFAAPRKIDKRYKVDKTRLAEVFRGIIKCQICCNFSEDYRCFKSCLHPFCSNCLKSV
jgi:hypothetical protein